MKRHGPLWTWLVLTAVATVLLSCKPSEPPAAVQARPVRVVTIERQEAGETISLTGQIEAENAVNLSFRVGGRMVARSSERFGPKSLDKVAFAWAN